MISSLYTILYLFREKKSNLFIYRTIKLILNITYPVYCKFSKNYKCIKDVDGVILSLTSFPARIDTLWIVIETLLRQTYKPEKIILWLANSQFESYEDLPIRLRKLTNRGLEIRFCDDMRSHKKYYYTMKNYPDHTVITVDDDTFYPENLVENLIHISQIYPNTICCNLAHRMTFDSNDNILPYTNWDSGAQGCNTPSDNLVPIGCEGVLYPPGSLNKNLFDKEQILQLCPLADDLWLKAMASLNEYKSVKVRPDSIPFANLLSAKKSSLNAINVNENKNDEQLRNVIDAYPKLKGFWKRT
ncbi:hypothetical protein [Trichococcus shcherbakoviae]|uniref:hypothetical protein n=1 Tax=Trichococcus shcherbakoviae TaxID=2094020 RepID=UPI002AA78BB3|nr:hypothetical protein [Trichococcus shcherbakoviae]